MTNWITFCHTPSQQASRDCIAWQPTAVYDECKYSDTFWLADRTCLLVQCTISLFSLCKLIWRHWIYRMPVRYILSCVSKINSILSVIIHYTMCGAACFQFTHFSCDDWENIYTLSYHHLQIRSMGCYPLFRVRSRNNGVRCMSFYILMNCDMAGLLRGTFVSWWYLPRIWPSVTDMQYNYHTRYPADDWHLAYMFSLVYFSVEVCLEGVFPHSVSTWRDSCIRVCAPLTVHPPPPPPPPPPLTKKKLIKSSRGNPALHLNQERGHLNWCMGLPALLGGNLGCQIF